MIGGVSNSSALAYQSGNNTPARERTEGTRAPAANPQALTRSDAAQPLAAPVNGRDTSPESQPLPGADSAPESRRVDARRAAEDVRLERFRADELALPTARALSAFADVAAAGQAFEAGEILTGIDITV